MKIVIAPQGFKAGISGLDAAKAIARGVTAAVPDAETVLAPVADGGDGTMHALVDGTAGQVFTSTVTGPLGQPIEAQWGVMGDGRTAVIEMALASGLALIPQRRRNPRITTTAGTGEILKEALDRGYTRIIVGLGGSATNDGGAGMASALGARFLDAEGRPLSPRGRSAGPARRHRIGRPASRPAGSHNHRSDRCYQPPLWSRRRVGRFRSPEGRQPRDGARTRRCAGQLRPGRESRRGTRCVRGTWGGSRRPAWARG